MLLNSEGLHHTTTYHVFLTGSVEPLVIQNSQCAGESPASSGIAVSLWLVPAGQLALALASLRNCQHFRSPIQLTREAFPNADFAAFKTQRESPHIVLFLLEKSTMVLLF